MSGIKQLMEEQTEAEFLKEQSEDFMVHTIGSAIDLSLLYPYVMAPLNVEPSGE